MNNGNWPSFGSNQDLNGLFSAPAQTDQDDASIIEDCKTLDDVPKTEKRDDRLKNYRSAKYSDAEIERIEMIKQAIATDNDSKALRWCLEKVWDMYGEQIERVAQMRSQIGTL